jgi:choice-of-anchor A domain-containing protein
MSRPRRSTRRWVALTAAFGLIAGGGLTVVSAIRTADPAAAVLGECPDGTIPGPGNDNPVWTDNNVAIYAGGDFRAENAAAEAEGLVVVQGDADFTKTGGGTFNVGWVGVGSWVVPSPGEIMLAVGGDLSVGAGTVLDVGANARDAGGALLGGNVDVGGITTPDYELDGSRYRLNNGTLEQGLGAAATAPWAGWGATLTAESAGFAALAPTGTVTAGATLTFTGAPGADPQVFTVDAAVLAANPAITFLGLADDVPVIINVTGGPAVTWAPNYIADETGRVDVPTSPRFGVVASRTLFNFVDATSVHLAGTSNVMGTILVPGANPAPGEPTIRVTAQTNGRLLTNGTIVMDGVGNEHHNYPWIAAPFECIPTPIEPTAVGSVSIAKALAPEDAGLVPPDLVFHGVVVCEAEPSRLVAEWYVAAGETVVVDDLPVGAPCVIVESLGPAARAVAPHPEGRTLVPSQIAWQTPVWDPSPPEFVVPAPTDPLQLTFTVTNALQRGSFTIEKAVTGEGAPDVSFSGTWACTAGATAVDHGTWTLSAGQATAPIPAPVGTTCTVSEATPVDPAGGSWSAPVIDPASVVITTDSAQTPIAIVVTNTFTAAPELGGFDIVKVVSNPDGVAFDDSFGGTWSCSVEGSEVAGASWTATTAQPHAVDGIAVGAVCSVSEISSADPAGGSWGAPQISPETFTVTDAATRVLVTVTNTLTGDEQPATGGETPGNGGLPATGATVPWWAIAVGGSLLAAGAVVVGISRARRGRG